MSLRGYSYRLVKAVQAANPELIGVRLGQHCIAKDIPVWEVADKFAVSRMAVYQWFTGKSKPHPRKAELISKFLSK
jgi:hypothetical protein